MKLRRLRVENALSFLRPIDILFDSDISILVGPNGGGKSNILDIISSSVRRYIVVPWTFNRGTNSVGDLRFTAEQSRQGSGIPKYFDHEGQSQKFEIEIETTSSDVQRFDAMCEMPGLRHEYMSPIMSPRGVPPATSWATGSVKAGTTFVYTIADEMLHKQDEGPQKWFLESLNLYELFEHKGGTSTRKPIRLPYLLLPSSRPGGLELSLSLAHHANESQLKNPIDSSNSRSGGSPGTLALYRMAMRMRHLEIDGKPTRELYDEPHLAKLTEAFGALGYGWELKCVNPLNNSYQFLFRKGGKGFSYETASSGEKVLLEFLLTTYGLDVREALVVIDEPELHLHPEWQKLLTFTIELSARDQNNQYILATHSPTFVTPSSVSYISRVYQEAGESNVFRLRDASLPALSKLMQIVNSQNNEKIFFTDLVILVEGILDRVFFERVFKDKNRGFGSINFEVVDVGGKGMFPQYQKLLKAININHVTIADRDYVQEIGTPDIKSLFTANLRKVDQDVLKNPKSQDGTSLASELEKAVQTGDTEGLKAVWNRIKTRVRTERSDLNEADRTALSQFIESKRKEGVFILSLGSLEDYLPEGYRAKDLGKLLELLETDFWRQLDKPGSDEIALIVNCIKSSYAKKPGSATSEVLQ